MTFLVALMLCDRGELDFNATVATYWPEFAANGKEDIEGASPHDHCAGTLWMAGAHQPEELADWDLATSLLAAQKPWWDDRTKTGYHAISQGFLIGEVVRRITGTTIGQFFKSEVARRTGADFFIGLPESEEGRSQHGHPPAAGRLRGCRSRLHCGAYAHLSPVDATMPAQRWWRAAEIPAATVTANARSVATIQQIIAKQWTTRTVTASSRRRIGDMVFTPQVGGVDMVLAMNLNFGLGYGLASPTCPSGHAAVTGAGTADRSSIMDQDVDLTIAYMMNKMQVGLVGDTRGSDNCTRGPPWPP